MKDNNLQDTCITASYVALENVLGRSSGGGIGNKIEIPFFHTFLENEWSGRSERRPSLAPPRLKQCCCW